jgi:diamine N-acetyltransferase
MITLRELREDDAELMLEWMHDPDIQKGFKKNMLDRSIDDARKFCIDAKIPQRITSGVSIHLAIVDDTDEYLGTVSLKNIDLDSMTAEYAITTRKKTNGKGVGYAATGMILKKAFYEYGLHRVYLSVFADNTNAISLYEKCGFKFEGEFREHIRKENQYMNWKWYGILNTEYSERRFGGGKL